MLQHLSKNKTRILDNSAYYLMLCILTTLTLSTLNLNSYFIVALFTLSFLSGNISRGIKGAWNEHFFQACTLLFVIYLVGAFYTSDFNLGVKDVEQRLSLVVIPFIFCCQKWNDAVNWKRVMVPYSVILFLLSVFCLFVAAWKYFDTGQTHYFFYHELVSPFAHHAIYFSILVFMTLVFLVEEGNASKLFDHPILYYLLMGYFYVLLILLSSKLVILASVVYALSMVIRRRRIRLKWYSYIISSIVGICIIVFTHNPVKDRFTNISNVDFKKIESHDMHTYYFNGVEFRLMQWKLVPEILNERKRWLVGVAPADAQTLLNEKYKQYKFYQGDPNKGDKGYLDYNAHNQFLQCLLQSGIIGLLAFLWVCYELLRLAVKKKNPQLTACAALFILFCFTESVLQTQWGIVSFTLFPMLIYFGNNKPGI